MSVNKTTDVTERDARTRGETVNETVKHYYIICLLLLGEIETNPAQL